ncbi:hypothetical protein J7E70_07825 [Variovorax paradoxus]|nr:hypothetical protein [Variovorax paradoxus]MBT2300371.1 hypothetical protein [Variovorax paradoxus]
MTVIAWDGRLLAADKRTSFGGLHATTQKLHRVGERFVGCAGNTAQIQEMLVWLEKGDPEKFPATQRSTADCVSMLVIDNGRILQYENTPYPMVIENGFWAIGSGRDFAMAAMHLGKTAEEAVEVACHLDATCGNGIDVLEI